MKIFQWVQKAICFFCPLSIFFIVGGIGCGLNETEFKSYDIAMGTVVQQTLYGTKDLTGDVRECVLNLESVYLSKRLENSEIGRINAKSEGESYEVSQKMYTYLENIFHLSEITQGAFDVTVSPIVDLWNIDQCVDGTQEFLLPNDEKIFDAIQKIGYQKVYFNQGKLELKDGMALDLGAVGKGIACDEIKELLEENSEIEGAIISVGGSVLTYGRKPDGSPWTVAVKNPRENEEYPYIATIVLDGTWFISTSGDYERYVFYEGKRYHHILNPFTGYPADSGLISVTVLSKSGLTSDALSTACFVLGKEKGMELAEQLGVYILVVDKEGRIDYSKGMEKFLKD